ncbi:ATP-binding protein [Massilia norwichensis]|uniref:ATP-binding protein n=1 Tax=Massilia norwichensis TaxID=1442366 RepID=A0ABT2AAW1_9BURK|nr:ATP-binding protein [Massilia norwichensis]MCS0591354.1 ATP-binding protein [Massilia norwichensis]
MIVDSSPLVGRFALNKLVMVDSYTTGRITELPLQGGTAITGRNGRGKTSLLKLIPAFFGERPDRIVRPVSNQQNFARYYLPRSTSYIIYEYDRDGVTCCAILCSDVTGDAVEYRFVNAAFQRDWFVHDDGKSLVANTNLLERFKLKGVTCSRKMHLDQYRAVIQGKRTHGSDPKQHRRDLHSYAFCPPGQPLPHIERIVFGMFTRKTNFADLQRMIVATVTDAAGQISLGAERKKVEGWPDAYHSYSAVMTQATRMEEVEAAYLAALAAEQELRNLHGQFQALDDNLRGQETNQQRALNTAQEERDASDQRFSQLRSAILERIDQVGRSIEDAQRKLNHLAQQKEKYQQEGIEQKAALVDQEAELLQARARLEERKGLLLNKQSNIEEEYDKLVKSLELEHSQRVNAFERQRTSAREDHQLRMDAVAREFDEQEILTRHQAVPEENQLQAALEAANVALGLAQAQLQHPQPDPKLVEIAEQQEVKVGQAREKYDEYSSQDTLASKAHEKARHAFDQAEMQLQVLKTDVAQGERRLNTLLMHATPDQDSVLYALRAQHPGWTQDIAKVLREDLLTRTDLAPVMGELTDSIYGLRINLDGVEAPLMADEQTLQQKIEATRDDMRAAKDRIIQHETNLTLLGSQRLEAQRVADMRSVEAASAKAALASAEKLLKGARTNVQHSRDAAKAQAQQAHADADRMCRDAKKRLAEHRALTEAAIAQLVTQRAARKQDVQRALDQTLADIGSVADGVEKRYQISRGQIEDDRIAKLRASGVDTTALAQLDVQINTTRSQLNVIADERNHVMQWRIWQTSEWSQRDSFQDALATARKDKAKEEQAKESCMKVWNDDKSTRRSALQQLAKKLEEIAGEQHKVQRYLELLEPYAVSVHAVPAFDPAWQSVALIGQYGLQMGELKKSEERLMRDIDGIKKAFTAHRMSPPDQYYETHRQSIGPDRATQAREWVPAFKAWYSSEHLIYQNLLRVEARTIAEAVGDFRNRMDTFHRKVLQFNRELQDSLNANQGFESIGQLSVEIVSSIRELEYWSTIEKVIDARNDWQAGELVDLPPPAFATALRELLDHWHLKEGIQAELTNLVRIQGEVVENGNRRPFRKAEDLESISSNGLSYIVIVLIFVAFINRVRGSAPVNVVWALDEIKDLDLGNVELLMDILNRNNITLVSACPDPDPDVLALFCNRRSIKSDRCIYDPTAVALSGGHDSPQ